MLACPIYSGEGAVVERLTLADTLFTPVFQHNPSRFEE